MSGFGKFYIFRIILAAVCCIVGLDIMGYGMGLSGNCLRVPLLGRESVVLRQDIETVLSGVEVVSDKDVDEVVSFLMELEKKFNGIKKLSVHADGEDGALYIRFGRDITREEEKELFRQRGLFTFKEKNGVKKRSEVYFKPLQWLETREYYAKGKAGRREPVDFTADTGAENVFDYIIRLSREKGISAGLVVLDECAFEKGTFAIYSDSDGDYRDVNVSFNAQTKELEITYDEFINQNGKIIKRKSDAVIRVPFEKGKLKARITGNLSWLADERSSELNGSDIPIASREKRYYDGKVYGQTYCPVRFHAPRKPVRMFPHIHTAIEILSEDGLPLKIEMPDGSKIDLKGRLTESLTDEPNFAGHLKSMYITEAHGEIVEFLSGDVKASEEPMVFIRIDDHRDMIDEIKRAVSEIAGCLEQDVEVNADIIIGSDIFDKNKRFVGKNARTLGLDRIENEALGEIIIVGDKFWVVGAFANMAPREGERIDIYHEYVVFGGSISIKNTGSNSLGFLHNLSI